MTTPTTPALKLHDAPVQTLSPRQLDAVTRNVFARVACGQPRNVAIREACADLGYAITDVERYLNAGR